MLFGGWSGQLKTIRPNPILFHLTKWLFIFFITTYIVVKLQKISIFTSWTYLISIRSIFELIHNLLDILWIVCYFELHMPMQTHILYLYLQTSYHALTMPFLIFWGFSASPCHVVSVLFMFMLLQFILSCSIVKSTCYLGVFLI